MRVSAVRLRVVLARSALRKEKRLVDRCLTWMLARMATRSTSGVPDDSMRDDIIDAAVGFEPDELERYQKATGGSVRP